VQPGLFAHQVEQALAAFESGHILMMFVDILMNFSGDTIAFRGYFVNIVAVVRRAWLLRLPGFGEATL
jgi:hypothetical protein